MYVHDTYTYAYHIADEVELNNDINYEEDRSEAVLVVGIHHHIGKAEGMRTNTGRDGTLNDGCGCTHFAEVCAINILTNVSRKFLKFYKRKT